MVDDLDDPATASVVTEHASEQRKVRLTRITKHTGPYGASASRNIGAKAASSEWLAFMDDDDLWTSDHLTGLAEALQRNPQADAVISWMGISRRGKTAPHFSIRESLGPDEVLARNPGITGSNLLIRRSAYLSIGGFDPYLPVSNDKDLFYRLLTSGFSYAVSPRRTAVHRQHEGEQLTNWNEKRAQGMELFYQKHRNSLSLADSRLLKRQIHSIRARTAPTPFQRGKHTLLMLLRSDLEGLQSAARAAIRRLSHLPKLSPKP